MQRLHVIQGSSSRCIEGWGWGVRASGPQSYHVLGGKLQSCVSDDDHTHRQLNTHHTINLVAIQAYLWLLMCSVCIASQFFSIVKFALAVARAKVCLQSRLGVRLGIWSKRLVPACNAIIVIVCAVCLIEAAVVRHMHRRYAQCA